MTTTTTSSPDEILHVLTLTQAKALFNRDRTAPRFFATVRVELPIFNDEGKCFPGMTSIRISKDAALKLVEDLLRGFSERGATIRVTQLGQCYFIG